ncbi:MAG TPA: hypothetical protein VFE82_15375 [Ramlibacter sp.]|jgi:hypothetical protein|uniref:hypothetical protein n=1 Tax=Ramlibacter sp. TaxID=1917967 RepID=UPI002D537747|nr:hypothetical protein [Ramlibacter sp.]HZY19854.1 hypothetical protein [Ramlibacter sp.]
MRQPHGIVLLCLACALGAGCGDKGGEPLQPAARPADAARPAAPGKAGFAAGARYRIVYTASETGQRGLIRDVRYEAELQPDPQDPSKIKGGGHYAGKVVYRKANCRNAEPENTVEVPVAGDLQGEAFMLGDRLGYSLITTDWRLMPFTLNPAIYGDTDYSSHYADTAEKLDAVRGSGSVANIFEGVPITGPSSVQEREVVRSAGGCDGDVVQKIREEVTIVPASDDVLAVPDVSVAKFRGEKVVLDGSRSTPANRLRQYAWTLEPDAACPPGMKTTRFEGKRVEVQLLCPARATLTVSTEGGGRVSGNGWSVFSVAHAGAPGKTRDTKAVGVPLKERPWTTPFRQDSSFGKLTSVPPLQALVRPGDESAYQEGNSYGRNVCRHDGLEGEQYSGHAMHMGPPAGKTNIEKAVQLAQVTDPNSPSKDWWFVQDRSFEVARAALVHPDLWQGSAVHAENMRRCAGLKGDACGFRLLMDQVRVHEKLHGELMQEALLAMRRNRQDPAQVVEAMMHRDRQELFGQALGRISAADTELEKAGAEPQVRERMKTVENGRFQQDGSIWLPLAGSKPPQYRQLRITDFSGLGS